MNNKEAIEIISGILFITILNKFLKKIIKQRRPMGSLLKDYGMPSFKAALVSFIAIYLYINTVNINRITKILIILFIIINCLIKYYNNDHTLFQLFIGILYGSLIAYIISNLKLFKKKK